MTIEEMVAREIEKNKKMAEANKALVKAIWGDLVK